MRGQISFEGQPPPPGFDVQQLEVGLTIRDDVLSRHPSFWNLLTDSTTMRFNLVHAGADGAFVLHNAIPDVPYHFALGGNIPAIRTTVRYGDADVGRDVPIVVKNEAAGLQVRMDWKPQEYASVEVTVLDQAKPRPGVLVWLASTPRKDSWGARDEVTDAQGKVSFPSVAPGDYEIYAWEDARARHSEEADPLFLDRFEGRGQRVHVEGDGTIREIVQIIKVERGGVK